MAPQLITHSFEVSVLDIFLYYPPYNPTIVLIPEHLSAPPHFKSLFSSSYLSLKYNFVVQDSHYLFSISFDTIYSPALVHLSTH